MEEFALNLSMAIVKYVDIEEATQTYAKLSDQPYPDDSISSFLSFVAHLVGADEENGGRITPDTSLLFLRLEECFELTVECYKAAGDAIVQKFDQARTTYEAVVIHNQGAIVQATGYDGLAKIDIAFDNFKNDMRAAVNKLNVNDYVSDDWAFISKEFQPAFDELQTITFYMIDAIVAVESIVDERKKVTMGIASLRLAWAKILLGAVALVVTIGLAFFARGYLSNDQTKEEDSSPSTTEPISIPSR